MFYLINPSLVLSFTHTEQHFLIIFYPEQKYDKALGTLLAKFFQLKYSTKIPLISCAAGDKTYKPNPMNPKNPN